MLFDSNIILPKEVVFTQKKLDNKIRGRTHKSATTSKLNKDNYMTFILLYDVETSKDKRDLIAKVQKFYKHAPKKTQKEILDVLEDRTDYHRKYLIYLLSIHNKIVAKKGNTKIKVDITKQAVNQRGRKPVYPRHLGEILYFL